MLGQRYLYNGKPFVRLNEMQLESKMRFEKEEYLFENYSCECSATEMDFDVLAERDRYGLKSRTVICRKCGLVMINPRMTQAAYDHFYDTEYGKLYRNRETPDENYFAVRVARGKRIYDYLQESVGVSFESVLEIGCAAGGILQYFKEQGCEITGVDVGGEYIEYGKARGLNLRHCHSSELVKEGKKYDLIIVNHVMEHFLTFETELSVIGQLLAEDGMLYVEVPGIKNITDVYKSDFLLYLQNAHVYNFTLGSLENVMNKYGFSLIVGDEVVRSVWKYTGERKEQTKNYFCDTMSFLYQLEAEREADEQDNMARLEELNGRLVSNMKEFVQEFGATKSRNEAWLQHIFDMLNREIPLLGSVFEALNRETEKVDEMEFNRRISALNDAVNSGDGMRIEAAVSAMIPILETVHR